jgi:putative tricarboxylic transport membrane protein
MDIFSNLALGFSVAFTLSNLSYCMLGVFVGTAIGVLPGVGPLVTIAVLLPLTFGLPPEAAMIMLAGIYYGAAYGGSTTAILVNLPGESSSAVTCIDGYQMARQGRAGPALAISAIGSFVAGCFGVVLLAVLAPPLTELALAFGAPEF